MASDRPLWHLKYEGREYIFDPQKLVTVNALRQFKQWFSETSPELGRYLTFIQAFTQGDPDAALCALWLVRRAAGESEVPEPKNTNGEFSLGEFYDRFEAVADGEEGEEANPTSTGEPQTPASTETPTTSGADISVS